MKVYSLCETESSSHRASQLGVFSKPPAIGGLGISRTRVRMENVVIIRLWLLPLLLTNPYVPNLFLTSTIHNISGKEIPEVVCS